MLAPAMRLFGCLALLICSTGLCAQPPAAAHVQDGAVPAAGSPEVATVNGEAITAIEWVNRMQALTRNDFNASAHTQRLTAGQLALDQLVNDRLIMQYTAKVGLQPTSAEVDAALAAQKSLPGVKARLDNRTLTEAQLREAIVHQKAFFNFVTVNQTIAEADVRAYYDANYGLKWQIALVRTASREKAGLAYAALKRGVPFATVVAQYSEDPTTKAFGGKLSGADGKVQWFTAADPALPPFVIQAVRSLKRPGDYTPIVAERAGGGQSTYFILEIVGRYQATDVEYARVRDQMRQEALLRQALRSGSAEQKLEQARKEARIVVHLPGYEQTYPASGQK